MSLSLFPSATLAEFYRFALLLTGDEAVAQSALAETLHQGEAKLTEMRHKSARQAWLIQSLRDRCAREHGTNEQPATRTTDSGGEASARFNLEALTVAQRFSTLPEPQRSTLALFYLELFDAQEIARLLKVEVEDLARTLAEARALLRNALQATATHEQQNG